MKCQSHLHAIQSSVKYTILSDKDTYSLERLHYIQNEQYSHDMKQKGKNERDKWIMKLSVTSLCYTV